MARHRPLGRAASLLAMTLAFATGACGGGPSELERANARMIVSAGELRLAQEVAADTRDGRGDTMGATIALIELVREHREALGDEEADRVLLEAATNAALTCPSCELALERELAQG